MRKCGYCGGLDDVQKITGPDYPICKPCRIERGIEVGETRDEDMFQNAYRPDALFDLVKRLRYKPGWTFQLRNLDRGQGSWGLTLDILTKTHDSYHPEQGDGYRVHHYMIVPAANYDERSWRRWLLEQVFLVEKHEASEFFQIDGERPYAPLHLPGSDPYMVTEISTSHERRTSFRGIVNPE